MERKLTLALTHYNRFQFLCEAVHSVLHDPRISEIVISDDCSTDGSYLQLVGHFQHVPKVRLHQNPFNMDCYFNKRMAVEHASHPWVILFDSDNIMTPSYLDALFALPQWNENTFYCPVFAEPHFDYRAFQGRIISRQNVARMMPKKMFSCALNTANYLVPRDGYLRVWDRSVNPHTSDSIFQAYNWLKAGGKMFFVPKLRYFHRIHPDSHYKLNVEKTGKFAEELENLIRQLQ